MSNLPRTSLIELRLRLDSALAFAKLAHGSQVRKYTGEPYINHPIEVADIVGKICGRDYNMIIAALLHDTVEDTAVTLDLIRMTYGQDVRDLVYWLTDPEIEGNRAVRKAAALQHLAQAPARAKTIKLADLISNTSSIVTHDPDFARVYLREEEALLGVLKEGDAELYQRALDILNEGKKKLEMS